MMQRCCPGTTVHTALPVCEWPAMGMPWATARSNAASAVCSRCGGACIGCCGHAGQVVFWGGAVLLNAGVFKRWRHCSATTARRALPVFERPTLGMPWGTARPKTASAVCSMFGGAFTGFAAGVAVGLWGVLLILLNAGVFQIHHEYTELAFCSGAQKCRHFFIVCGQTNADTLVCIFYSSCLHSAEYESVNQNDLKNADMLNLVLRPSPFSWPF